MNDLKRQQSNELKRLRYRAKKLGMSVVMTQGGDYLLAGMSLPPMTVPQLTRLCDILLKKREDNNSFDRGVCSGLDWAHNQATIKQLLMLARHYRSSEQRQVELLASFFVVVPGDFSAFTRGFCRGAMPVAAGHVGEFGLGA